MVGVLFDDSLDLNRIVPDDPADLGCFDYPSLPPFDKGPDGYLEEFSGFFLGEKIRLDAHIIKLSRGIPVSLEISSASAFPKLLLPLK